MRVFCIISLLCLLFSDLITSLSLDGWALLNFRSNLEDDPNDALLNWNANDTDPCGWFGVRCEYGRVISVNLSGLSLRGTLIPELGQLTNLRELHLELNHLEGSLPSELGKLTKLNKLVIHINRLSGTLLVDRILSHCFGNENIHESGLCKLKCLKDADFSDNYFEGDRPSCLHYLPRSSFNFNCLSSKELSDQRPIEDCAKAHVSSRRRILQIQSQGTAGSPAQADGNGTFTVSGSDGPSVASPSFTPSPSLSPIANGIPLSPTPSPSSAPLPEAPIPSSGSSTGSKPASNVISIVIASTLGIVFAIAAIILFCCYCHKGTAVRPWRSGLSGEIKKGFSKGVPAFRKAELEAACEDFSNIIGVSRDIVLFKGTLNNDVEIAVTSIRKSAKSWSTNSELIFWRKVESLSQMKHENLVNLIGYCAEEKPFVRMLVFEYVPNGTVHDHLHNKDAEHLDWETRVHIIVGVARALDNMHHGFEAPIIHTKLNSKSVFLSDDYTAKVADFGVWKASNLEVDSKISGENVITSSDHEHLELSEKLIPHRDTNIYEFGVFLLEMVTGRFPTVSLIEWALDHISRPGQMSQIVDPTLMSYNLDELEAIGEIAYDCLQIQATSRGLTMREIYSNLCSSLTSSSMIPRSSPLLWAELEILSQA